MNGKDMAVLEDADIATLTVEGFEEEPKDDGMVKRDVWSSKLEFILTLVGAAVGLGNIWRFPYLCYRNGGGAFLIPYFICLVLIGIPTLLMEMAIGQFSSLNMFSVWNMAPLFKGLGIACLIVNLTITTFYSVVISWAFHFFFSSFTSSVPWSTCDNWWNTEKCCTSGLNLTTIGNCSSPSEEYFYNKVLRISDSINDQGTPVWELVGCLVFVWVVVFGVLCKGISSLGKVVYFFTTFPYILLTIMLVRGATLDGAGDGIYYYVYPQFSALASVRAWSDAATQIFFSLSLSHGPMLSLSSFSPFKNNIVRDSFGVAIINCLTSFYGGFAIFSVLGYMAKTKGVPIENVVDQGPGLVFVGYPEALAQMPLPPLWSVFFFLMMISLGLSSLFSLTEVMNTALIDNLPFVRLSRLRVICFRALVTLCLFLISCLYINNGGFFTLTTVDYYLASVPMLACAFCEMTTVAFVYGYKRFAEDVEMMIGHRLNIYFRITLNFLSPLLLLVTLIASLIQYEPPKIRGKELEFSGIVGGWVMTGIILSPLPLWCLWYYLRNGGWQLIKKLTRPTECWGPMDPEHRIGTYADQVPVGAVNEAFQTDAASIYNFDPSNYKF